MSSARIRKIVRQFKENGLKLLLEDPQNARDLLLLTGADLVALIDFEHLTRVATTFVRRDYRHIEADVVLVAPLRAPGRLRQSVLVYILIEHQSKSDRLMPLRLLEYMLQIYQHQIRRWTRHHRTFSSLRLHPVLPVVFYTGTRRWDSIGRLIDLLALAEYFERVTPSFEPLFINLPAMPSDQLESAGGFFGWVLRLVQQRRARPEEYRDLLRRVVQHLETMPAGERLRWLELLSYIHALVYHDRAVSEQPGLRATIEASVGTDEFRKEERNMVRSMADVHEAQGRKKGEIRARQHVLLMQLQMRFGDLPAQITKTIKATNNVKQLDAWLGRTVTARTLTDMRIEEAGR